MVLGLLSAAVFSVSFAPEPSAAPFSPSARLLTEEDAPLSSSVSVASSVAATAVGWVVLASLPPSAPPASTLPNQWLRLSIAAVMIGAGPSLGDLINGDWRRFSSHSAARVGVYALGVAALATAFTMDPAPGRTWLVLGASFAGLVWFVMQIYDLIDSAHSPARWAARQNAQVAAPTGAGR